MLRADNTLLVNNIKAAYATGEGTTLQDSITVIKFSEKLTVNDFKATLLLDKVKDIPCLSDLIIYILQSDWYQKGGQEQLPKESNLRRLIPKRRALGATNSPFGAFFRSKAPYTCVFCDDSKGRALDRALGHARGHFNYTFDGHYTNQNTKNDQLRRARGPSKVLCSEWWVSLPDSSTVGW